VVTSEKIAHPGEDIEILMDELNVKAMEFAAEKPAGMAVSEGKGFSVCIDMTLTPELEREGMARDIVRRIQSLRKDMDLQYDRCVAMGIDGDAEVMQAFEEHMQYITQETLATEIVRAQIPDGRAGEWDVLGKKLRVWLRPV
jgi:isoleucyl-tRNA synthetase